jgi:hypothetical protein
MLFNNAVKCMEGFGWGYLKEGDHLDAVGVDRKTALKWTVKT